MEHTNDLCDLSADEMVARVRSRELSPVEIVQSALDRIEEVNGAVNAMVTLNPAALDDARAQEGRAARGEAGLLCGIPVGIKDVTAVAGLRTTYGSPVYADHVPDEDALVVTRLREAGAVIIGKTNCPEFGAGANTFNDVFGRTRNPWDLSRSAGGSTGGGAAALATGMIALADGTDLGGSLRIPAAFCGVVGLRPSPGLVPIVPNDFLWDTLQAAGPMARTAIDASLMLDAIAGPSDRSPLMQPAAGRRFHQATAADPRTAQRLAWCPDLSGIGIDAEVARVCRSAVSALAGAGVAVEEIDLDLGEGREAFLALRGYWFVAQMHGRMEHLGRFGANVAGNIRSGLGLSLASLGAAEHARARVRGRVLDVLARFDHLLTPATAVPPFPVEQNYPETVAGRAMATYADWLAPTSVLSLTALPVGAVPCGVDSSGMPVGMQVVGRPLGEEAVLATMQIIEQVCPMPKPAMRRR